MPSIEPVHIILDLLAIFLAMLGGWLTYRWRLREFLALTAAQVGPGYFVCLWLGSVLGAYGLGTFNLFGAVPDNSQKGLLWVSCARAVSASINKIDC